MNNAEFRAVLDWWMCSDPWCEQVPKTIIDDWLDREAKARGYADVVSAYHEHVVSQTIERAEQSDATKHLRRALALADTSEPASYRVGAMAQNIKFALAALNS